MGPIQSSLNRLALTTIGTLAGGIKLAQGGEQEEKPEAQKQKESQKQPAEKSETKSGMGNIVKIGRDYSRTNINSYIAAAKAVAAGNDAIEQKAYSKNFSPEERVKQVEEMSQSFSDSLLKTRVFHGSPNEFDKFDISKSGKEGNKALWFTDNLDYAESMIEEKGNKGFIYNSELNIKNPEVVELSSADFADPDIEKQYIKKAKESGKDSVIFKEITKTGKPGMTSYAVFSEAQTKIKHRKKIGGSK